MQRKASAIDIMLEESRRPRSVRGWLLWFLGQRSRLMVRAQNMGGAGGRISAEKQEENRLQYALVTRCLVAHDVENDLEDSPLGTTKAQAERRIEELLEWLSTSAETGAAGGELVASNKAHRRQAADLGLGAEAASRYFGYVEGVLRRRMRARGLIGDEIETEQKVDDAVYAAVVHRAMRRAAKAEAQAEEDRATGRRMRLERLRREQEEDDDAE